MASKDILSPRKLADGQSLASNFNSSVIALGALDKLAVLIDATSVTDNTGTFLIQYRMNDGKNLQSSWSTLSVGTVQLADADTCITITLDGILPGDYRVNFTSAGSTPDGSCDIWISGKGS